jgi:hypothetical protein
MRPGLRSHRDSDGLAEGSVHEAAVAEAVAELFFQAGDRVEVLRGARRPASSTTSSSVRCDEASQRTTPASGDWASPGRRTYQLCRSKAPPMENTGVRWPGCNAASTLEAPFFRY